MWGYDIPRFFLDEEKMLRLVTTHKANLYRKDPVFYHDFRSAVDSPHNSPCCEKCNYYWPTHDVA